MKVFKKVTLISIMILYVLSIKSFAATGKINVSATRLRKENNTTSEILTNIYENEEVEILEENGEWVKIEYKNQTGFIMKKYVDIETSTQKDDNNKTHNSVYENENNSQTENNSQVVLKVSSELKLQPNFMSKKTESLVQGINLTITDKIGKWIKVTDGTVSGWILENKVVSNSTPNVSTNDIDSTQNSNTTNNTVSNTNTVTNTSNTNSTNTATQNNAVSNENITSVSVSKTGKINVETAKVRKGPSKSYAIVDFLDYDDEVSILEEAGDWYYVTHGNIKGYVNKSLITLIKENDDVSSRGLTEERKNKDKIAENSVSNIEKENTNVETNKTTENLSQNGASVEEYAKQFLGYPYVLGGKNPDTGFDCSGFTRYVYQNFGYSLASVAASQTNVGREISREELEPGDLILFYNDGKTKIGHTGIYLGNGDFIHSANPERGVVIDNINKSSYYNQRFVTARRIVE